MQSNELVRSASVIPGPQAWLSLHGDQMLVSAQGMAEEEALGPTAGCVSVIQESFELGAWNVVPSGSLRNPPRSLHKERLPNKEGSLSRATLRVPRSTGW